MSRNVPSHHKPFPELVEPEANSTPYWVIDTRGKPWLPTNGMTSLLERKILVPLVAEARSVSRHELAHVKWSPIKLPKIDYDLRFLMAVEDARINLGLVRVGLSVDLNDDERKQVLALGRDDLTERNVMAFVLRAVAAQGTNIDAELLNEVDNLSDDVAKLCRRHVRRIRSALLRARRKSGTPVAEFRVAKRLAAELARDLGSELERLGYRGEMPSHRLGAVSCCLGGGRHRHGSAGYGRRGRGFSSGRPGSGAEGSDGSEGPPSGEMETTQAALLHPTPRPRIGVRGKPRATYEGSVPRTMHRWPIDGAIFRRVSRARGGTVLIDTSGSMSLDAAGVDRILVASSGAALVAIYSGRDDQGELRVIARDGLRADSKDLVPYGRGNIVDEHALTWLARQKGPRLWISDGGVTGVGDSTSATLQRRCQEIAQRARIRRVKTVEEAVTFLTRGARHAGVARAS